MTIDFTKEEAQVLFNLIDLAVKAGGIQVAAGAAHLAKKIDDAVKASNQSAEKEE